MVAGWLRGRLAQDIRKGERRALEVDGGGSFSS